MSLKLGQRVLVRSELFDNLHYNHQYGKVSKCNTLGGALVVMDSDVPYVGNCSRWFSMNDLTLVSNAIPVTTISYREPEYGDNFQDAIDYASDMEMVKADLCSWDEVDPLLHDLLVAGRADLALPLYLEYRSKIDNYQDRSLLLLNKYRE